jgi:hypothetical protein
MILIYLINGLLISIALMIHYEVLMQLSKVCPNLNIKHRFRVLVGLFGAFIAHVIEVWIFGFAYYLLITQGTFGKITGVHNGSLMDCVYFSFVNYTTLGYGDMIPEGMVRYTASIEALTGLVLIAMTSSFLFMQIQKFWSKSDLKE